MDYKESSSRTTWGRFSEAPSLSDEQMKKPTAYSYNCNIVVVSSILAAVLTITILVLAVVIVIPPPLRHSALAMCGKISTYGRRVLDSGDGFYMAFLELLPRRLESRLWSYGEAPRQGRDLETSAHAMGL